MHVKSSWLASEISYRPTAKQRLGGRPVGYVLPSYLALFKHRSGSSFILRILRNCRFKYIIQFSFELSSQNPCFRLFQKVIPKLADATKTLLSGLRLLARVSLGCVSLGCNGRTCRVTHVQHGLGRGLSAVIFAQRTFRQRTLTSIKRESRAVNG